MPIPGASEAWRPIVASLATDLAEAGLDLVAPFAFHPRSDVDVLPSKIAATFASERALAIVVGNSRALHTHLFAALARDATLHAEPHPVDRYVEDHVSRALARLCDERVACAVRYAHAPDPTYAPIQRLAVRAGLVTLGASGLGVHPIYGPWVALRAIVAIDVEGPIEVQLPTPPCECEHACLPHRRALEARIGVPDAADLPSLYEELVAMRDACPVGRAHRYDDDALRYHTTKDRSALDSCVSRARRAL